MAAADPPTRETRESAEGGPAGAPAASGRYWLRVYGYPAPIGDEEICYPDFYDPRAGRLRGDPPSLLQPGDTIVYYADGPSSLFGIGVVEEVTPGPEGNGSRPTWRLRVKPQVVIKDINKAAHAAWLTPPSGWRFLRAVRDYTFIRLPEEDGPYLAEQVRARASAKGE